MWDIITDAFIYTLHADMAITTTDLKPSVYPSTFDTSLRWKYYGYRLLQKSLSLAAPPTARVCDRLCLLRLVLPDGAAAARAQGRGRE